MSLSCEVSDRGMRSTMILVSDVDRTLVEPGGLESQVCRDFFAWLVAKRIPYCLATARSYPSLRQVLPASIRGARAAICSDGVISLYRSPDSSQFSVVYRALLRDAALVLDVLDRPSRNVLSTFVFLDDRSDYHVVLNMASEHATSVSAILNGRPATTSNLR